MNRITFITPPSWPDPPAGYLPEPGWRPDPSWGPAPAGFQFYRDPFGFPTPPPPEYWQPWASTDWDSAGTMPVARVIEEPMPGSMISTNPAPTRRKRRWVPWLVGLVLLGIILFVALFASVLFLAGIADKLRNRPASHGVVVLAGLSLVSAIVILASLPTG